MRILKIIVRCVSPRSKFVSPRKARGELARAALTLIQLILIGLVISSSGCAFRRVNLKEQLANQGPQALSAENPYVAANQLLAEEIESSATLRGFISIRGTPDALEVKQDLARNPIIQLYYLDRTESFVLERLLNDWVIKGPDVIPREFLGSFFGVVQTEGKAPLVLSGEVVRHVAAPRPQLRGVRSNGSNTALAGTTTPQIRTPPSTNRSTASAMASNESLSGDVMHSVKYQGETLRIIATWYTGSAENAERLARINGLSDPNHLELGQEVRIPRYLTRNTNPLSEQDLQRLIAARNRAQ